MRLWSSENYKCMEEYSLSGLTPLVDFDFDESKVKKHQKCRLLMNCLVVINVKSTMFQRLL